MKKRILAILLASALTATPVSYVFAEEGTTQSIQTQEIQAQEVQAQEVQAQEVQAQTQEVPVEQGGVTGGYLDNDLEWNPPVYSDEFHSQCSKNFLRLIREASMQSGQNIRNRGIRILMEPVGHFPPWEWQNLT